MEATKKVTGKSVKKWLGNNAIIVLMLAVSLIVGIIHPNFFALANIINLFKNVSIRYIIALGISGCLITTGNDLSAGRLAGFAACPPPSSSSSSSLSAPSWVCATASWSAT